MKQLRYFLILLVTALMFACSSSQESTSDNGAEQEIYVFDDITETELEEPDTVQVPPAPVIESSVKYIVQVGAFTTEDRARTFVEEKENETAYPLKITFSSAVNLFVVQLPPFDDRADAERVRNELWDTKKFEDAFILTAK